MKLQSIILFTTIFLMSNCKTIDTSAIPYNDDIHIKIVNKVYSSIEKVDSRYSYVNELKFTIDNISVDSSLFKHSIDQDTIYQLYITEIFNSGPSGGLDFSANLHGYTKAFFDKMHFVPDILELNIDHNSVMFLNLVSQHKGKMDARIFDVETGERVASFFDNNHDGSTYYGIQVDTINLSDIMCLVNLNNKLYETIIPIENLKVNI